MAQLPKLEKLFTNQDLDDIRAAIRLGSIGYAEDLIAALSKSNLSHEEVEDILSYIRLEAKQ